MDQFDQRLQLLPPTILTAIAEIDELKGRWIGGVQLNPQTLARLKQSVLVTSTGASTRIEGARLSDEESVAEFDNQGQGKKLPIARFCGIIACKPKSFQSTGYLWILYHLPFDLS